jgi:hypothetical protein
MAGQANVALSRTTYAADSLDDFTWGLDLGPVQQIPVNGVALARDVDFSARGGFTQRCGIVPFDYATPKVGEKVYILGTHNRVDDGVQQVFAITTVTGEMWWSSGGGWFTVSGTGKGNYPVAAQTVHGIRFSDGIFGSTMAQFSDRSYIQNGAIVAQRWNGYVRNNLGNSFNDNIAAPTGGNMPVARLVAAHREYVFVAYTDEHFGTYTDLKPRRIRWSHPGQPEDWRTQDFIDIPNGTIRALLPFQDFLMVFTDDEIYGLYGTSTDDFSLQRISGDTGTQWARSITRGPGRTYWWDWDNGVMCYDGRRIFSVFDKLSAALQEGQFSWGAIQNGLDDIVELCWSDGRLYVGKQVVPTDLGLTLVFDPSVGKTGAWTTYDWGGGSSEFGGNGIVSGMTTIPRPSNFDQMVVGLGTRCYITNDNTYDLDYFGGAVPTAPTAPRMLVRTSAMTGSTNATKKRFRRPRMALRSGSAQSFAYRWVRDYDPTAAKNRVAADYITVLLDNVTNRPTDYAVWDGVDPTLGVGHFPPSTVTITPTLLDTADATAATVTSGTFTTALDDVILVTYAAYDDAGTTMTATITENMAGTVFFNKKEQTFVNGGKSAVFGGFITKCPAGGAGATVQVDVPGADDIAIAVYKLANAQARFLPCFGTGFEAPASGGVGTLVTGDCSYVTANDQNFICVVVAELTNSDIDLGTATTDIEDNNANNILGLGHKVATVGSVTSGWLYVSGTNTWGCAFGFIVPGLASDSDGVWNTDLWGGNGVQEFVQFETEPSAGAGHVVQLEIRNTFAGDAAVRVNGTVGINDSFGMDSTIVPYREKGLR